jgi:uncharacterized protein (TIGR02145 family)
MKRNLLLMMMCIPAILAAQQTNGVTVSNLAVDAGTVTFNVSWETPMPVALWSDTVWVFVDYNNNGVMERLPVTDATASAGTVTKIPGNDKGVWIAGNARTNDSFSAKVELFTEIKDIAGACAYASNYPPVGLYIFASEISFTGTPDYKVTLERYDKSTYTVTVSKNESLLISNGEAALSFTDKTGVPGVILRGIFQPQGSCTYTEPAVVGTFASFPSTYSGATYVSLMDARDGKVYPVVKVGNRWMMARNLNYQNGLTWQANSSQPSNVVGQDLKLIGNFWCSGTGTVSTREACEVYGALYSWETAMMLDGTGTWTEVEGKYNASAASAGTYNHGRTAHSGANAGGRGICPSNWHVPTDFEWGVFFDKVEGGGTGSVHQNASGDSWIGADAGKKSKAACVGAATDVSPLWTNNASTAGIDSYGFRVLPAGNRDFNGAIYKNRGSTVWFWSSSASDASTAWDRDFNYDHADVLHHVANRSNGISVRCIRD